jgi:two-component system chemotaxis response regulator CheB
MLRDQRIHEEPAALALPARPRRSQLVAIGVSTGGPSVLQSLLRAVPTPFALPILVTQHNARGFNRTLATWLAETTGHRVAVCGERMRLEPGRVYVSCDERHMRLVARDVVASVDGPYRNFVRPSVDELFDSVATFVGAGATAILLTGMGRDGAEGLLRLRELGAQTIVQTPESCTVAGMPRAALALGAADAALLPSQIAAALARIARCRIEGSLSQRVEAAA